MRELILDDDIGIEVVVNLSSASLFGRFIVLFFSKVEFDQYILSKMTDFLG